MITKSDLLNLVEKWRTHVEQHEHFDGSQVAVAMNDGVLCGFESCIDELLELIESHEDMEYVE